MACFLRSPTRTLHSFPFFPLRATCPVHPIVPDMTILIVFGEKFKSRARHYAGISFPLGSNILLSTLFSNILSLFSSLNVRGQVSQPHKTTGQLIVLCILVFPVSTQQTGRQNDSAVAARVLHI